MPSAGKSSPLLADHVNQAIRGLQAKQERSGRQPAPHVQASLRLQKASAIQRAKLDPNAKPFVPSGGGGGDKGGGSPSKQPKTPKPLFKGPRITVSPRYIGDHNHIPDIIARLALLYAGRNIDIVITNGWHWQFGQGWYYGAEIGGIKYHFNAFGLVPF